MRSRRAISRFENSEIVKTRAARRGSQLCDERGAAIPRAMQTIPAARQMTRRGLQPPSAPDENTGAVYPGQKAHPPWFDERAKAV